MPYAQLLATERTAEADLQKRICRGRLWGWHRTEPKGALCFCSRRRFYDLQKPNPLEQSQYLSVRTVLEHPQSGASMRDGAKKN